MPPPLECPINVFNTYIGMNIDKVSPQYDDETDIETFLYHLRYLAGDEDKSYNYLLKYTAHMVQRPGELPRTAVCIRSEEEVGKNLFWEGFGRQILGNEYVLQTTDPQNVIGRSPIISNKLLVILNELESRNVFTNNDLIKDIITTERVPFNEKFVGSVLINNFGRYLFFNNNKTPICISSRDKRFVVFEVSNKHKQDAPYMKNLIEAFNNEQRVRKFYDYLMSVDISEFDITRDRPITKAYCDMQSVTIPTIASFLEHFVYDYNERMSIYPEDERVDVDIISWLDLYDSFKVYCEELGIKKRINMSQFGNELNKYTGIEKQRTSTGRFYKIDYKKIMEYLVLNNYV